MESNGLQTDFLPYPLPPWRHRFRTLSVFCEVDESTLKRRVMKPLELNSNIIEIALIHAMSTVPRRPYYDLAVIAQVKLGETIGGTWLYGFTSTDQVLTGTREIWGYPMKLGEFELHVDQERIWGHTTRLGRRIFKADFQPTGVEFEMMEMFPRLFVKQLPRSDKLGAESSQVVTVSTDTQINEVRWGDAEIDFEASEDDPLHLLKPGRVVGAAYIAGEQVLNWGAVVG